MRSGNQLAGVFSALGITQKNGSRVGFVSGRDALSVCTLYGLNMTGASVSLLHELDLLDRGRWSALIQKEGITDLLLLEEKTGAPRLREIMETAEELGLRKVIMAF